MSGGSNLPSLDASVSSFSASSIGSDVYTSTLKYQNEQEKTRKLENKLAGYKTVVQQVPKYCETIAQLKKIDEEKAKKIAYYETKDEEQQKKILYLERQLQFAQGKENLQQGLTDLDLCHPTKGTPSQTNSSPSFEIIGKSPSSKSIDKDIQNSLLQEAGSPTQTANGGVVVQSTSSTPRNTLQYQQQSQQVYPLASKDLPVKSKITTIGYAAGPPKNTFQILRGFSTNTPVNENIFYSALDQLNSYPSTKSGVVPAFAIATGSRKPIWQMDHEILVRKSETSETTQQSPPGSVTSTQAAKSWGNVTDPSHISVTPSTATGNQIGSSDKGARLKEWKPLNTLILEPREHDNQYLGKSSDFSTANLRKHEPMKMPEDFEHGYGPVEHFPRSDLTINLNNLNLAGKITEETSHLVMRSEDLMKFPSLHTNSPSPENEQSKMPHAPSPIYKQQNGAIVFSTDEQSQLASQMENALSILGKNDSPIEMSDMLYKFAENAKNMESKLNEYKDLIKKQQVQIQRAQCLSNLSQEDENSRLREDISALKTENETLLDFIGALKENKENEVEPGWISLLHTHQSNTDPVRSHYPDSPIMKKIESLSIINAKLFQANKDWHNKWEILRQQTHEEKADLEAKVKSLQTVNESLKENIASLEKELQLQSASLQDLTKAITSAEEEKSSLHRIHEALNTELTCLKTEVKDLTRSKRMLESELITLKSSSRNKDSQTIGNKELQSEIGLLKQQLTIFAEDFDRERKDRLIAESRADKSKKELAQTRASLETRLKKMSVQIRTVENDLRLKTRQNADFLYQLDDLKLKLQYEQRKSSLASQNPFSNQHPPASYQEPVSLPYNSGVNSHLTNPSLGGAVNSLFANNSQASAGYLHQNSPEHLPGAWKCRHCTYVNYPSRNVCDICGYTIISNIESIPIAESGSGRNELQSRGEERLKRDVSDVVVDTYG